ncbi:hypothetical protein [Clostridium tarantellae]|uniref:DUF4829 domain-containing protein n=1 Tax=Clostridium tarantellae TaxID=39493 RepID=A0A6I1MUZ2_9CLOT|nr:hypothetical protein [Clostridium tarantellae]MPQ44661.1 hypothetical protein [Clostridium tarantellae]
MKRIILISTSIVLILGAILAGAYASSDRYTLEVYFRTPEDAINYIVENWGDGRGSEENFKDALSERAYYTNCIFNRGTYYYAMQNLKNSSHNEIKKLEDNKFLGYHELITKAIKRIGNRPYEIYYANLGDKNYYDEKGSDVQKQEQLMFLMVNNGNGWVLDTLSESYIPIQ